jgi:hypothetical protein
MRGFSRPRRSDHPQGSTAEGFGAGAYRTRIDAAPWRVVASGPPVETIALTGGAVLGSGHDFFH